MPPVAAMLADTLLVRPVDVPTPWYSVASGVLSIVVTLLLLGIAVALLGMARALKGAERNLGGRLQGLADELIPLARNLNQIATQLGEVTADARGDLRKLSGTIGAVDDAVRDALASGETRLHQFGTMLDAVQDEAQATVASATGIMRGVRTGAGSLVSNLFSRSGGGTPKPTRRPARNGHDAAPRSDTDEYARLAALEAAFAAQDDDEEEDDIRPFGASFGNPASESDEAWDDEDDFEDDDEALDTASDDDDDDDDDEWDDLDDEDDEDDLDDFDDDETDDDEDDDDDADEDFDEADLPPVTREAERNGPRHGGPRIRPRGRR